MVNAEVSFGEAILYVPHSWKVVSNVRQTFGSVGIENAEAMEEAENVLYVNGVVSFGALQVRRI